MPRSFLIDWGMGGVLGSTPRAPSINKMPSLGPTTYVNRTYFELLGAAGYEHEDRLAGGGGGGAPPKQVLVRFSIFHVWGG